MGLRGPIVLAVLGLLCVLPGLPGGFVWDDHELIGQFASSSGGADWSAALTEPFWRDELREGKATGYYRPVISLSYTLEYALFGAWPLGYRVSNLIVHLACILLAWRWLRRRLGDLPAGLSIVAMLPFVVHPSRVENVGWVSGRTDLWMVAAMLGALELRARRAPGWSIALVVALAVFCKEVAVVLPALLLVDAWAGVEGGRDAPVAPTTPSVAKLVMRDDVRWTAIGVGVALLIRTAVVSAPARLFAGIESLPVRVLTTLGHYLHGGLWPFWPEVIMGPRDRALPIHTVRPDFHTLVGVLFVLAVLALVVLAHRRRAWRPWVADGAWFVLPLLPVLNILPLDLAGLAALRFLYLPMLGLCALLGRGLSVLPRPRMLVLAVSLWSIALFAVTQVYALAWVSDRALWGYELGNHPGRLHAIETAAQREYVAGAFDRALELYLSGADHALARDNAAEQLRFTLRAAKVLGTRVREDDRDGVQSLLAFYRGVPAGGDVVLKVGDIERRLRVPELFAKQSGRDVTWVLVPHAAVLLKQPDLEAAAAILVVATDIDPMEAEAPLMLGQVRGALGDFAGAEVALQQARSRVGDDRRVKELSQRLRVAREKAGVTDDPLARAEVALILGVPAQTRRLLSEHAALADSRKLWWQLRIGLALSSGDQRQARALIERGRRQHPQWADAWRAASEAAR